MIWVRSLVWTWTSLEIRWFSIEEPSFGMQGTLSSSSSFQFLLASSSFLSHIAHTLYSRAMALPTLKFFSFPPPLSYILSEFCTNHCSFKENQISKWTCSFPFRQRPHPPFSLFTHPHSSARHFNA